MARTRPLKIGSLFAGIGGFDLGLERTGGFETAWFCEIEEYPRSILNQWWPGVPVYDDVTKLKGDEVEPVDILVGGFPCQDISAAGRGEGIGGERSSLWFEFARLVGELRPRYVIAENSPLLKTRGLNAVLGSLAEIGYDAEWDCVPARTFGAPHQRDRIWVVAYPDSAHSQGDGGAQRNEAEISGPRDARPDEQPRRGCGGSAVADPDNGAGTPERGECPDAQGEAEGGRDHAGGSDRDVERERSALGAGRDSGGALRSVAASPLSDPGSVRRGAEQPDLHGRERHPAGQGAKERGAARPLADADGERQPQPQRREFDERGRTLDRSEEGGEGRGELADSEREGLQGTAGPRFASAGREAVFASSESTGEFGAWPPEPNLPRVAHGVPDRVDRVKALGNALVPVIPEYIGLRILEWEEDRARG